MKTVITIFEFLRKLVVEYFAMQNTSIVYCKCGIYLSQPVPLVCIFTVDNFFFLSKEYGT